MTYTLYDGTIVVVQSLLRTLSHILHRAETSPNSSTLLAARLHEDMLPLADQVRIMAQYSENLLSKLMGRDPITFENNLTTFADCYARLEKVQNNLKDADKNVVIQNGDVLSATQLGPVLTVQMSGAAYAHKIALPNIYFHLNTAYGILRKEEVPLGKLDYYVGFLPQETAALQ